MLKAHGLEGPTRAPCAAAADKKENEEKEKEKGKGNCPAANLTLVLREDYVAHPRETKGGQRHNKIANPDELLQVRFQRQPRESWPDSPRGDMILREDLVDSHGRWKRPCVQTTHMTI